MTECRRIDLYSVFLGVCHYGLEFIFGDERSREAGNADTRCNTYPPEFLYQFLLWPILGAWSLLDSKAWVMKLLCTLHLMTPFWGKGVDITETNLGDSARRIAAQARELGAVVAVTGAVDLVTDGHTCYAVRNGRPEMGRVTGTGCQLSALLTAFLAVQPSKPLEAALQAVCAMGLAGELAWGRMAPGDGNAAYRGRIIDAIYHLSGQALEKGARYEAIPL